MLQSLIERPLRLNFPTNPFTCRSSPSFLFRLSKYILGNFISYQSEKNLGQIVASSYHDVNIFRENQSEMPMMSKRQLAGDFKYLPRLSAETLLGKYVPIEANDPHKFERYKSRPSRHRRQEVERRRNVNLTWSVAELLDHVI